MIKVNIKNILTTLLIAARYNNLYIFEISYLVIDKDRIVVLIFFDNNENKSVLVLQMLKTNNTWSIVALGNEEFNKDFFSLIDICTNRSYRECLPVIIKKVYGSNAKVDN